MNKQEFINELAQMLNLSKKDAQITVDAALDLIVQQVKTQGKVSLTGFGIFEAREQKATQRVNPQTGKKMNVAAKRMPKFRAGKGFKEAVNGNK